MTTMINELHNAGHNLTEEQKIQAVIHSLPKSWEHMKLHLTHASNIATFNDVVRHLELEEHCLTSFKITSEGDLAKTGPNGATSNSNGTNENNKKRRAKGHFFKKKKQKSKANKKPKGQEKMSKDQKRINVKCYNCRERGHFSYDCSAPKRSDQPHTQAT